MKRLGAILILALAIRLLILPFTYVNNADAVTRVFTAWEWLDHPTWMTHGGWGPLHFYLIAAALWLHMDTILSPVLLHLFFSLITAVPLWAFVRREWNESSALFVAAAYLFYPMAFNLGFIPLSEVPFNFFIAVTLYLLSRARREGQLLSALLAGLSLTLASALRYEAWLLIPLFSLVLWRRWSGMVVFVCFAAIFPTLWMIGNTVNGLDPVYGLTMNTRWDLEIEGLNEGLNSSEIVRRFFYLPSVLLFSLTPIIFLLCVWGMFLVWKARSSRLSWLIPFAGLVAVFTVRAMQGIVSTQARYSLLFGLLMLPFSAEALEKIRDRKKLLPSLILIILTMLPLSYCRVVLARVAGPDFPNPFPADIEAIPKVIRPTRAIGERVANYFQNQAGGLIVDYFHGSDYYGYKDQAYVALASRIHPSRIFLMPGGRHQSLDVAGFSRFAEEHQEGLLLLSTPTRFVQLQGQSNHQLLLVDGMDTPLTLQRLDGVGSITIFRYGPARSMDLR